MGVINAGKGLLLKNAQFNPPRLVSPLMFYAMMKFSTKGFCNDTNCSSVTDGNANESTWFTGKHDRVQDTASMNCVEHHQSISRDRKRGPRSLKSKIAIYQKSMPSIPSLKEFLHQQRVIHQYRHFLRAIANIDDPKWRDQLLCDVRKGFKDLRSSTDSIANQMALKEVSDLFFLLMAFCRAEYMNFIAIVLLCYDSYIQSFTQGGDTSKTTPFYYLL